MPEVARGAFRVCPVVVVAQLLLQGRLVALDRQDVGQPAVEDVLGGGDHATAGVAPRFQSLAQDGWLGVFLGPGEAALAEHQAGEDADRRELLPGGRVAHGAVGVEVVVVGATQGLAVEGQRLAFGGLRARPLGEQVLESVGRDVLERIMQGADAGGVVAPGLPAAGNAEVLQHGLFQGAPEVRHPGQGARAGQARGEHDRQQRREGVAMVRVQQRVEARHFVGPHHAHLHGAQRDRFVGHCPSCGTNRPVLPSPIPPQLPEPTRLNNEKP